MNNTKKSLGGNNMLEKYSNQKMKNLNIFLSDSYKVIIFSKKCCFCDNLKSCNKGYDDRYRIIGCSDLVLDYDEIIRKLYVLKSRKIKNDIAIEFYQRGILI